MPITIYIYILFFSNQVNTCVVIHQSVAQKSLQYKAELSRYNYVTPTSYLELLGIFGKMAKIKQTELSTQRNRTKIGLDKVKFCVLTTVGMLLTIL